MSKRESIAQYLVEHLGRNRYIKNISRNPINPTQVGGTAMPYLVIESANEIREPASFGAEVRRRAAIDHVINIFVSGDNLDSRRNDIIDVIEKTLSADTTLGGLAFLSGVSEIQIREIANGDPYAQAAVIFTTEYFYTQGNP